MFALSLAMSIFLSLSGLFDETLLRRVGLPSAGPWRNRSYDMWSLGILLLELVLGTRDTDVEMVLEGLLLCAVILVGPEMPGKMGGRLHNLIQVTVARLRWVNNVTMFEVFFPIRKGLCWFSEPAGFVSCGWSQMVERRIPVSGLNKGSSIFVAVLSGLNGRTDYLWGLERVMFRKSVCHKVRRHMALFNLRACKVFLRTYHSQMQVSI